MEPDLLFGKIYEAVQGEAQRAALRRAYAVALQAHGLARRHSGEPFMQHTLATAAIVQEWGLGADLIVMALLHDVLDPENHAPGINAESIQRDFGRPTADVVSEMARLGYVGAAYEQSGAIDELSKVLEGTRNLRVGLLKLASGLELSRDLPHVDEVERRRKRAQLLLAAYGPVAQRFGMWEIKSELEDHCLDALLPEKAHAVRSWRDGLIAANARNLEAASAEITARCQALEIDVELVPEPRQLQRLIQKIHSFRPVFDLTEPEFRDPRWLFHAVRLVVLTQRVTGCYLALKAVHEVLAPLTNSFSDTIVAPKSNGYASLHTAGKYEAGRQSISLRVRVRTRRIHDLALHGIIDRTAFELWCRRMEGALVAGPEGAEPLPKLEEADGERRCVEELVGSLIAQADPREGIRVFTPRGKEIQLAAGSTPLDLAYAIHSELGHQYGGARVNGVAVPITYKLQNNEVVEIQVTPGSTPDPQWLNVAVTGRAQKKIREWLNRTPKLRGQKLLNQELAQSGLDLSDLRLQPALETLVRSDFGTIEQFLEAVGSGRVAADLAARRLVEDQHLRLETRRVVLGPGVAEQLGSRRSWIRIAKCCKPAYPDKIVGSVRAHDVVIHKFSCGNLRSAGRQVPVLWQEELAQPMRVEIAIEGFDRVGFVRDVALVLAGHGINTSEFRAQQQGAERGTIDVVLELRDLQVLDPVMEKLRSIEGVTGVALRGEAAGMIRSLLQGAAEGRPAGVSGSAGQAYGMPNPYSPGRPITNAGMFFGRQREMNRIVSLISAHPHSTGVMICGNRRVGKTSLGLQVMGHHTVQREYVPIFCDLQYLRANDDHQVLRKLARDIQHRVEGLGLAFNPLQSRERDQDIYVAFEEHLRLLGHQLGGKRLLLVLDEFEALLASLRGGQLSERFFWALRAWMQMQPQPITVILLGTSLLPTQMAAVLSGVLNAFVPVSLGPLEPDDARRLVVRPVERYLFFEHEVVEELLALTAAYPYYLHVACAILFSDVVSKRRTTITRSDLEMLPEQLVRGATSAGYYAWLWNREDRLQALLLSAIAHFGDPADGYRLAWDRLPDLMAPGNHPAGLLNRLATAAEALHGLGTLEKIAQEGNLSFRIQLPLFRLWVAHHQPFPFMMTRMQKE